MAEPSGIARELVDSPLLNSIFDKLEQEATERAISALPGDDETRRIATEQVRAMRLVRAELKSLANGKTNRTETSAVA